LTSFDTNNPVHQTIEKTKMISFIVTGFGPFHGVPENPTMMLAQSLIEYIQHYHEGQGDETVDVDEVVVSTPIPTYTSSSTGSSIALKSTTDIPLSQRIRTLVIETSYKAVQRQIDDIYHEIITLSDSNVTNEDDDRSKSNVVILIHLGVNYKGQQYQLECCAYNEMNFRVPDMNGDQPTNCPIIRVLPYHPQEEEDSHHRPYSVTRPYQSSFQTKLYHHLSTLCQQLNESSAVTGTTTMIMMRSRNKKAASHLRGGSYIGTHIDATRTSQSDQMNDKQNDKNHDENSHNNHTARNDSSGYGTTVVLSTDPGRYVCNYIYFYSMYKFQAGILTHEGISTISTLQQQQEEEQGRGGGAASLLTIQSEETEETSDNRDTTIDNTGCDGRVIDINTAYILPSSTKVETLFVHVPPLTVASLEQQLQFVSDLIVLLEQQVRLELEEKKR
jgi:pyrrolidone-carboxylate peptidase